VGATGSSGGGFPSIAFLAALLANTPTILCGFNESSCSTLVDRSGNGNNGTYQNRVRRSWAHIRGV